jgi:hypothetical protein
MKLNVKTLKGTSFEIEAAPDASVRSPSPPFPPHPPAPDRARFGATVGQFARCGGVLVPFGRPPWLPARAAAARFRKSESRV